MDLVVLKVIRRDAFKKWIMPIRKKNHNIEKSGQELAKKIK